MIKDDAGTGDTQWRAAREEAHAALSDALGWYLPAARWEQVREAVADMAAREQIAELIDTLTGNGDRNAGPQPEPAAGSTATATGSRLPSRP